MKIVESVRKPGEPAVPYQRHVWTDATKWSELFKGQKPYSKEQTQLFHLPCGLMVSGYSLVTASYNVFPPLRHTLNVTPTEALLTLIDEMCVPVDNDILYFDVWVHEDSVCVYYSHNKIIGGRLLAKLPRSELPDMTDIDEPSAKEQEPPMPSNPDVVEVLNGCSITPTSVTLPPGQLPRDLYVEYSNLLNKLGGKWNTKAQCFLFQRDPTEALAAYCAGGKVVNVKKELQAFFSPDDVADQLVEMAGIGNRSKILEPSAGEGSLIAAIRCKIERDDLKGVSITAVEIDDLHFKGLTEKFPEVEAFKADFLTWTPPGTPVLYDAIIMNPPFAKGQDAKHLLRALRLLKTGGVVVSVLPTGSMDKTTGVYRQLWDSYTIVDRVDLPMGAFKESGTNIATTLVKLIEA